MIVGLIGVIVGTLVAAASVNVAMFAAGLVVLAAAKISYDVVARRAGSPTTCRTSGGAASSGSPRRRGRSVCCSV